jgi:hypothetical protein
MLPIDIAKQIYEFVGGNPHDYHKSGCVCNACCLVCSRTRCSHTTILGIVVGKSVFAHACSRACSRHLVKNLRTYVHKIYTDEHFWVHKVVKTIKPDVQWDSKLALMTRDEWDISPICRGTCILCIG